MRLIILISLLIFCSNHLWSQHEPQTYTPDPDPLVKQKLEQWQDLKFGLLMHWGTYSQWGIVESWSICPEDYGWCERKKGNNPDDYFEYVREYENLKTTFNPVQFDPVRWAKAAASAGMRYMIFTTKHHDGFCMFDTKYTDYKITDETCPFHSSPKANVTKEIFDAFRSQGMWVGPYFSKPEWHCEDYWDPYFPPMDRNLVPTSPPLRHARSFPPRALAAPAWASALCRASPKTGSRRPRSAAFRAVPGSKAAAIG